MPSSRLSTRPPLNARRAGLILGALAVLLALVSIVSLSFGTVSIPFAHTVSALVGGASGTERTIVIGIRLPRILLAICVGAGLSVSGVVFQALLRNPLAEPYILGISSGGTVGAVLAIGLSLGAAFGGQAVITPIASFIGSVSVMALVYTVAHRRGHLDTYALLLSGVMIGAFFNAAVLVIIALFNQELRNAFLWLMGSLSNATLESIAVVAPVLLVASFFLLLQSKHYNVIATGDETALQLGTDVQKTKRVSYLLASLVTGVVVSVSGVIGFVGLIIPHICRMLFGPDHRLLLPASFLLGASFVLIADLLSRSLMAPAEIPVGAVTAAIGAPLFIYLLRKY